MSKRYSMFYISKNKIRIPKTLQIYSSRLASEGCLADIERHSLEDPNLPDITVDDRYRTISILSNSKDMTFTRLMLDSSFAEHIKTMATGTFSFNIVEPIDRLKKLPTKMKEI